MKIKLLLLLVLFSGFKFSFSQQVQWASRVINYSSQKEYQSYSANQVLGEPNSMPSKGYSATAWESASDERKEFLHVGFEKPMKIRQVIIAENLNPGAVVRVLLYDKANAEYEILKKPADTINELSRYFYITVNETPYEVAAVKIYIDCRVVPGINQIDAIGISSEPTEVKTEIRLAGDVTFFGEPEPLGPNVNSRYEEVNPIISPDGKTLFFTRKNYPPNHDDDEIWYSVLDAKGEWSLARNVGSPLNNSGNNFVSAITPDGNTMLLGNQYFKDPGSRGQGFSLTHKITNGWGFPVNARVKNFINLDHYINFYLTNDGKKILMNVRREDTRGTSDIYISFLQPDGSWSEPVTLGSTINSGGRECCAFLAADNTTLYFASDGYNGFGSNDIYLSRRLDDTWQHWSEPLNIGQPVNSDSWDAYYTIPAKGDYAFFVRDGDIYRIRISEKIKPKPVLLVYGTVYNTKTNAPVPDAKIMYEYLHNGIEAGLASSSPESGEYKIVLPYGFEYGVLASAKGFVSISDSLNATTLTEYREIKRDLYLVPAVVGEVIRLNNIFFDFGKSQLKIESYPELNRVVNFLNENANTVISLGGHTDNIGSDTDNLRLSQERISSVKAYLVSKGISGERLYAVGYGESKPIAENETEQGRALNRRVEFTIVK